MSEKNKKPAHNHNAEVFDAIVKMSFLVFTAGWILSIKYLKNNPDRFQSLSLKKIISISASVITTGTLFLMLAKFYFLPKQIWYWVFSLIGIWLCSIGAVFGTHRLWNNNPEKKRITTRDLKNKAKNFDRLVEDLYHPARIPIGISLKDNSPYHIPADLSLEHIVVSGATGVGKTTTMITMVMQSLIHKRPVIIIDPKGDFTDLELIKKLASLFGREKDLQIFSFANPETSCSYNPIKFGDQENKRSKLIEGLQLDHEYYGSVASNYLGILFDVMDFLGEKEPTLSRIENLLTNQNERSRLEEQLKNCDETDEVNSLLGKFEIIKHVPMKDLAGLVAKISSFGLRNFHGILDPTKSPRPEIDLVDVLQNSKIAYFQLNTNSYGEISRGVGKILLSDIKQISNIFQSHKLERKYQYAGVFVDEFGSFAIKDFADFQKQVRTAHIGLRLFFQGMADLRAVSPEFEEQVLGNCLTKIILRQDIDSDVQKWSGMAGTQDAFIQSYQTQDDILGISKTGMGNLHEGKKVKIDFDVFKELGKGQAVVIDKGRKFNDLIQIWDAKNPNYLNKLTEHLKLKRSFAAVSNANIENEKCSAADEVSQNSIPVLPKPIIFRSNGSNTLSISEIQKRQIQALKRSNLEGSDAL